MEDLLLRNETVSLRLVVTSTASLTPKLSNLEIFPFEPLRWLFQFSQTHLHPHLRSFILRSPAGRLSGDCLSSPPSLQYADRSLSPQPIPTSPLDHNCIRATSSTRNWLVILDSTGRGPIRLPRAALGHGPHQPNSPYPHRSTPIPSTLLLSIFYYSCRWAVLLLPNCKSKVVARPVKIKISSSAPIPSRSSRRSSLIRLRALKSGSLVWRCDSCLDAASPSSLLS